MRHSRKLRVFQSRGRNSKQRAGKGKRRGIRKGRNSKGQKGSHNKHSMDSCICPHCGEEVFHQRGVLCSEQKCPSCGAKMMKKGKNIPTKRTSRTDQKNLSSVENPTVDQQRCVGCGNCIDSCPMDAIIIEGGKAKIQSDKCCDCGKCISACPHNAIE